ncbi:MAG TPA: M13 family metallopeptidase [Elusimicrobiota bacterium]|jgi:endothelin-converting enzyme/putative endopeptidase|nr:M13 family metallopeptidase [Elusimicrobiota bacterium]
MLLGAAPFARAEQALPPVVDPTAIDRGADPCQDFFQFACGNWLKENPVPSDESTWYRFSELDEHTRRVLRAILAEAAAEKDGRTPDERKIGDYYSSCMDAPAIDAKGLAPLRDDLDRVSALKDKAELPAEVARVHALGGNALFSFSSGQDYTNAERNVAVADQGGFSLPDRDYYLSDEFKTERAEYLQHLRGMFVLLGDSPEEAAGEAASVMKVETALAQGSMGRVERREPKNVHHKTALADFMKSTPSFGWKEYLAAAGAPSFKRLDVVDPGFFKALDASLKAIPLADWKSYLRWTVVNADVSMLPSPFVAEDFDFYGKKLGGQQEIKARWKRCVESTDGSLGEALGRSYVASEFPPQAKERVLGLVHAIEKAMNADIRKSPWMSEKTKRLALRKLAGLANKIGYPDKWRDYSKLDIVPGDALGNLARADAFEFRRQLNKIGRPVDHGEWDMTPPTDNAYYDPQMNDINFPAGILQLPNFDMRADTAAVFGSIGATVGHELTHGFDDEGRHYDVHGNLKDWWSKADAKAFAARAQGFVDEYSSFAALADAKDPSKSVMLNGRLTLGENIADNGGLFLSYMALLDTLGNSTPPAIDGFGAKQRFFVSYGQSWCMNQTDESIKRQAKSDPHSTGRWRVNGVVSNMPEFAQAFSCKEGSPMAPVKPNRVW